MLGRSLGTLGPSTYFNSGFTYYELTAAPAFAEVKPIFDRVNETWKAWTDCEDDEEAERLFESNEAADRERAALPLRLVSPDGATSLSDAIIHVHMEDSPPCLRVNLGKGSYDTLRAAGLFR